MKEMVINDEPQIFELLERYQSSGNEQEFVSSLLSLLRPHQKSSFSATKQQAEPTKNSLIQPQKAQMQTYSQEQQPSYSNNQGIAPESEPQYYPLERVPQQSAPQQQQQPSQSQQQDGLNAQHEQIAQFIEKHPDCPDEISSPLGLKLLKRKQKAQKNTTQIKDYLKPYKIDQE